MSEEIKDTKVEAKPEAPAEKKKPGPKPKTEAEKAAEAAKKAEVKKDESKSEEPKKEEPKKEEPKTEEKVPEEKAETPKAESKQEKVEKAVEKTQSYSDYLRKHDSRFDSKGTPIFKGCNGRGHIGYARDGKVLSDVNDCGYVKVETFIPGIGKVVGYAKRSAIVM